MRNTPPGTAMLIERIDTKTRDTGNFKGEVGLQELLKILPLSVIHNVIQQIMNLGMLQWRDVDSAHITINPDHWG